MSNSKSLNYEELFFNTYQIYETIIGNSKHFVFNPSFQMIEKKLAPALELLPGEDIYTWDLKKLFEETGKYIADIVRSMLFKQDAAIDYMDFLKEAYQDDTIGEMIICTLNHDLLLEKFLFEKKISCNDGFELKNDKVEIWESGKLFEPCKTRFLKLHGSINWFSFPHNSDQIDDYVVAKLYPELHMLDVQIEGLDRSPLPNHPLLIMGTGNKLVEYHKYIFFELQIHFFLSLRKSEKLFISGYSFADLWIDRMILDWMRNDTRSRIVIAHHDYEALLESTDSYFRETLMRWKEIGRLNIIDKKIQNVEWIDICTAFDTIRKRVTT